MGPKPYPVPTGLWQEKSYFFLPRGSFPIKHPGHGMNNSRTLYSCSRITGALEGQLWRAGLGRPQSERRWGGPCLPCPAHRSAPAAPAFSNVLAIQLDVVSALLTEQRAPVPHDQLRGHPHEGLLHVARVLGRRLNGTQDIIVLCQALRLSQRDLPELAKVRLVPCRERPGTAC